MKSIKFVLIMLVVYLSLFATQDNQNVKKSVADSTKTAEITFIELGSVKCIPCRMMQPVMAEIEKEYPKDVKVVFYDVWTKEGEKYAQIHKVKLIPTQVFLDKDGKEFFRHQGFFSKEEIVKLINKKLKK